MATTEHGPASDSEWDLCEDVSELTIQQKNESDVVDNKSEDDRIFETLKDRKKDKKPEIDKETAKILQKYKNLARDRRPGTFNFHDDPKFYATSKKASTPVSQMSLEEQIRAFGFTSETALDLPKSFLMALQNRFSHSDIIRFREDLKLGFNNPLPYFVLGSFMFPATLRAVTTSWTLRDLAMSMCPATVRGYQRRCVPWAQWPAVLPAPSEVAAEIKGMLVFGITESQRSRIHAFEGGMFDLKRVEVEVELSNGEIWKHEAGMYVWNKGEEILNGPEKAWSPSMLMTSEWHQRNIERASAEEEDL
jgi:hypothetical protein